MAYGTSKYRKASPEAEISGNSPYEAYYNYTRSRFACDEENELFQRRVIFDVEGLRRVAAAATGAARCDKIEKCIDGMFNKAFILTMDDGQEVVAKLPNPNAGRPHFTTASEVATMDFMRNTLNTPVPKILAWSSSCDNEVRAEYIIMQKVAGVHLDQVWPRLTLKDRFRVIKNILRFQAIWASFSFPQYGSLYYAKDMNRVDPLNCSKDGIEFSLPGFAIGPSTSRDMTDDGRSQVDFDRGPWSNASAYHKAVGEREQQCVNDITKLPRSPITLQGPGLYLPSRARKQKAISAYLDLVDGSLPVEKKLLSPCLWHPDLHGENIFVLPENPTEISGFIDWQSAEVAPLFAQVRQPHIIQYSGPPLAPFEEPEAPENIDQLDEQAQKEAWSVYYDKALSGAYRTVLSVEHPVLFDALKFHDTEDFTTLLLARALLVDGEAQYLMRLETVKDTWQKAVKTFPMKLTEDDKRSNEAEAMKAIQGMDVMQRIREDMGDYFPDKGLVQAEQYDETKRLLKIWKARIIDEYAKSEDERKAWDYWWPFE